MKIKHSTWRRFCRIIGYLFLPFGILDFIRPSWWSETDWNISIGVFFIVGFAGALVAILARTGKIEFVYSENDKNTNSYKMSKFVAEQERQNSSVKDLYSKKYYESFNDSKASESDHKSSSEK